MAEPTLLERLRACELLSAEQVAELERLPEATDPDPKVLARVVLQRGWLTRFQVGQVATGKGKDLFVGPYVLLDRLGEGGMGQVLKARHRHMKRVVALKLIRKEKLGGADVVARFYQEVEAAGQLHHPNIVLAFDVGQAGGTHFFAMEYVEGPDLTRLVREKGTLPVAQACGFIRQAAVGLQHAHERGLVHRDIKPSNLLVTASAAEPVVKILDLGLARLGDTFAKERNLTKMGQVIGTPDYLAPEQALDARNVDIRADIYSLGCSLYFLLAARAPFQAESLTELLMKHQMNDPAPIRSLRPDVPQALEALLRRMMAKKPQDRPDTPAEVAAALEPFARGERGSHADAPSPVSIAAPTAPRSDETWAGLSNDGEVVARPKARASRARDTIDEEPRPRRKKEKGNKGLLIGGAVGAGVLVLALIGGVVMLSPKKPEKVVEKKPGAQGTQGQEVPPPEAVVPPVPPKGDPPADGARAELERAVRQGKMTRTAMAGGGDGGTEEYADLGGDGALLTGLEVGLGKWGTQDVVHYLRPVYQTRAGRALGKTFGAKQERTFLFEAKPGYAVSGLTINAGAGLDGLSVQFMAIKGAALDPADSYEEYWVGGKGGNRRSLGGDGAPVVGLYGKLSRVPPLVANGLGLVMGSISPPPASPPVAKLDSVPPPVTPPKDPPKTDPPPVVPPKPDVVRFEGHTGAVYRVAVSPDGKLLLSCGEDGSARLWDAGSGQALRSMTAFDKKMVIRAVCFTRDGAGLLGFDDGLSVYQWQTAAPSFLKGTASGGRPAPGLVSSFALSASGECLGVASGRTLVPVRLLPDWKLNATAGFTLAANASCIASTEGNRFAVGDVSGTVRLADLSFNDPKLLTGVKLHKQAVLALVYNTKTRHLISGGIDKTIKVTLLPAGGKMGKTAPKSVSGHEGAVTCLAVSPDGKRFASGSKDMTVRIWDMTTLKEVQKFTADDEILSVAFAKDGKGIYVAGKTLRLLPLGEAKKEAGKEPKGEEKP